MQQTSHVLERTNAKGTDFIGRCILCGKEGLRMVQANEPCENPPSVSRDDALLEAIFPGSTGAQP